MEKIKAKIGMKLMKVVINFLQWGRDTFPEDFDAEDKAMMKRDALAGGFTEEMCDKLFKI